MKALGTSYKMWSERKLVSKEAAHATRIVGAILRKISLQEPSHMKSPLPPKPKPEVRDGSLASLLNNDAQPPPLSILNNGMYDQASLIPAMDFSLDFDDTSLPLDHVLSDPSVVDWVCLDN